VPALVEEPGAGDAGGDGFGDVVGGALEAGDLRMRAVANAGVWRKPGGTLDR
jgi:hypothetical protein